jgi:hypothetical protein
LAADRSATQTAKEARDDRAFYLAVQKTTMVTAYTVALMAAIVTTLAYVPLGALVAILAFGTFDVPLHSLLTFGGQIHIVAGLVLWWGIAYLPALLYAAVCVRT